MRLEPFRRFHIEMLRAQGVQRAQLAEMSIVPAQYASVLESAGPAFTGWEGERIVGCAGMVAIFPHYGVLWAVLAEGSYRHLLRIHRAAGRFIEMQRVQRLEVTVEEHFEQGKRWIEMLGFEFEGSMRGYGIDGSTHLRYARVQSWPT